MLDSVDNMALRLFSHEKVKILPCTVSLQMHGNEAIQFSYKQVKHDVFTITSIFSILC